MSDDKELERNLTEVSEASPYGTARVADSYGPDPHQHYPSQDPFDPETAEAKQAPSGGVPVDEETLTASYTADDEDGEEESSPGNSSSTSENNENSSDVKSRSSDSKPARTTESHSEQDQTEPSSARSTGGGRASRPIK